MEKLIPEHRFRFIELIAYWEGHINSRNLIQQFGFSRQQCSVDLSQYNEQAPNNLRYDSSLKAYRPTENFHCYFITGDVVEYLNWLHSPASLYTQPANSKATPYVALRLPTRQVSPQIMRGLIAAINQGRRLDVDYVSLSNPNREGRIIVPHTFVNTGLRWHLRAWCEKSQAYRDFVLSRFRGNPELLEKSPHAADADHAWKTQVTIILAPDPRLSPAQQDVLAIDYQMDNGQLHIATRACLVQYLLQEMQINTKMLDGTPEAQQLICVNPQDIKPWLFSQ